MGGSASVEGLLKFAFEHKSASSNKFNIDVALFYASVAHVLVALCYYLFYKPDESTGWGYGKLKRSEAYVGRSVPHSVAWMVFESPSLFIPVVVMVWTRFCNGKTLNVLILLLFAGHYLNRSIIYPLLAKKIARDTPDRNVPLPMVLAGVIYTSLNGLLQSLSAVSFAYDREARGFTYMYAAMCRSAGWQESIDFFRASQASAKDIVAAGRYAAGIAIFIWGMRTNIQSDLLLMRLRYTKNCVEKREYSVPLPCSTVEMGSRTVMRDETSSIPNDSESAAPHPRAKSAERTASRDQQFSVDDARRKKGPGGIAELAKSRRVPGTGQGFPDHNTSADVHARTPPAVYHYSTRKPASAYKIPRGMWCEYVSCPNYFGEICEWVGFAIAADTYAALSFAIFTGVFLTTRALCVHKWYRNTFGNMYPESRRAVIPGLL